MIVKCIKPGCNNEQEYKKGEPFCEMCGTKLPQTKNCIACGKEISIEANFCSSCGAKQDEEINNSQNTGFHMGNDNIINGDYNVVGKKEDYHITGNATFVNNEDETKKIKKCEICGSLEAVTDGYECNTCGKYVCEECFDKKSKQCKDCSMNNDISVKLSTKSFLPEESRYKLEDAYNNFMNRNETSYRFNETKKLLTKYPDNENVIDVFLQMAEFVDYKRALEFIEEFNKKVENGQEDLLCVHLSLIRLKAKLHKVDEMQLEIEKVKLTWKEYSDIKIYEAMHQILMSEKVNDERAHEKLNKANELIQSFNFDEEDKITRSYVYFVKCLYDYKTNEDFNVYDISKKHDLYPRIILNYLDKVTVSQNDVGDFKTISEAIEKSPSGSHLWITSGKYEENIQIDKEITLEGVDEDVWIISNSEEPCITVNSNNALGILNLKFTNRTGDYALLVEESVCEIRNCSITDSNAGLYLKNSSDVYINGCLFDNNKANAVLLENSKIKIANSEIKNSGLPQVTIRLGSVASIKDSKILSGEKKGIIVDNSEAKIENCEFSNNRFLAVESRYYGKVILDSCKSENDEVYCWYHDAGSSIECNNCKGFIIEDETSDKEFNKKIELTTNNQKNIKISFEDYKKATELDNADAEAWNNLGECYYNGYGTDEDIDEAFRCFKKATEIDETNADAWNNLGNCYYYGYGTDEDNDEAFRCYKKATEIDETNADAWNNLGNCYYYGNGTDEDDDEAFRCYKKATVLDETNADAWNNLGNCYYYGYGTDEDDDEAFICYNIATVLDETNANAWNHLGDCYYYGKGTEEDDDESLICYKKATEIDETNADAWNNLGNCYYYGNLIETGRDEAFRCYKKAIKLDETNADAWNHLGGCYYYGYGTEKNYYEAFMCYKKATELDDSNSEAWINLGDCYYFAKGIAENNDEAFRCYKKATEVDVNNWDAWINLARCYKEDKRTENNEEYNKCIIKIASLMDIQIEDAIDYV